MPSRPPRRSDTGRSTLRINALVFLLLGCIALCVLLSLTIHTRLHQASSIHGGTNRLSGEHSVSSVAGIVKGGDGGRKKVPTGDVVKRSSKGRAEGTNKLAGVEKSEVPGGSKTAKEPETIAVGKKKDGTRYNVVEINGKRFRMAIPTNRPTYPSQPLDTQTGAACLLVNDENPRLPEWLAYHYHVLPLRHLTVAVDPASRSSPAEILERWKGLINVKIWGEEDFLPKYDGRGRIGRGACDPGDPKVRGYTIELQPVSVRSCCCCCCCC